MSRPPKKTETIEIRLAHETKLAFMARCRDEGVSASEALRTYIGSRLEAAPAGSSTAGTDWRKPMQWAAGAAVALGVAATAVPSLAGSSDRNGFRQLDQDGNGAVSRSELERSFVRLDADRDGSLSLAEFRSRRS